MKTLIGVLLLLSVFISTGQTTSLNKQITEVENNLIPFVPVKGFDSWNILERMRYYHVAGASIAVIKDYKIAWAKGYGLADTLRGIPVTTETMFSAGSISKFVAAVTALKLVQQNKLELDKPINEYLSSWKITENDLYKTAPVTLRMLLSHTAGTSQSSYYGFTPAKQPLPTITEILEGAGIAESRPVIVNSEPNKEFRYSGGGILIAQLAMMNVTKQPFSVITGKLIFGKLGMKHSTFEQPLPRKYHAQASWAYSSASWFKGMPYIYPQQAAAGLYTTPSDLARFFIDVQKSYQGKGKILNQQMTRKMVTGQVAVSNGSYKEQMGIGPFLLQRAGNKEDKWSIY